MRLIDADSFKQNILSGLYVFCQENKEDIARTIDDEPTVEPKRQKGKWISTSCKTNLGTFELKNKICDQCNHSTKYEFPFCPWCGAVMGGIQNEDTK